MPGAGDPVRGACRLPDLRPGQRDRAHHGVGDRLAIAVHGGERPGPLQPHLARHAGRTPGRRDPAERPGLHQRLLEPLGHGRGQAGTRPRRRRAVSPAAAGLRRPRPGRLHRPAVTHVRQQADVPDLPRGRRPARRCRELQAALPGPSARRDRGTSGADLRERIGSLLQQRPQHRRHAVRRRVGRRPRGAARGGGPRDPRAARQRRHPTGRSVRPGCADAGDPRRGRGGRQRHRARARLRGARSRRLLLPRRRLEERVHRW